MPNTHVYRMSFTAPPLNMNQRMHHMARARVTRQIREEATWRTRALAKLKPARITVEMHYWPRDKRRRDADNLIATAKPFYDGVVDAGVVPDDTPEFMVKRMPVIHAPDGDPRVEFHITIVAGGGG